MEKISKNRLKWLRSLQQKKVRDTEQVFIVEGEKMVLEALQYHADKIKFLCCTTDSVVLDHISVVDAIISADELQQVSSLKTPNKSLVVIEQLTFEYNPSTFTIALDSIQDPGNMGTILRLADWFGVKQIICSKTTVDRYNPKVIQASMGAVFRIPVFYIDLIDYCKENPGKLLYGAFLEGKNIYQEKLEPQADGILVLGNEGNGISSALKSHITHQITIPKFGTAESLNVSIATGILLSEFYRNLA